MFRLDWTNIHYHLIYRCWNRSILATSMRLCYFRNVLLRVNGT